MNNLARRIRSWPGTHSTLLLRLLPASALILHGSGCASGRPEPLHVQHPVAQSLETEPADGLHLKLLTYNIWGLPSWMTGARSGRYPKIAHELERLNPDIVLLQEAWTANARRSAPDNGVWSIARAAGQQTFFQQSGLVTLSRFPIIGGQFYPFSRAAFPDRFVNKGILKVTVKLPGGRVINIWNVHLQDGGSVNIRTSQVRELITKVRSAENGQIADLVGGDFNCTPESGLYRELENALGPSVQELGGINPFITWDGLSAKPGSGETLDYIFVKTRGPFLLPQATPRVAFAAASFDQRLSDHLGIETTLDLNPAQRVVQVSRPISSQFSVILPEQKMYAGGE